MGKRITSLQEITTVTDNDFIPVDNQSSGARKLSAGFLNDIEDALDGKQDALTAGANIEIAQDGTISATDTTYTAGTNITITNGEISATDTDTLSELTDTTIITPSNGQTLIYDGTSSKWINGNSGSGGGTNLFGTTDPASSLGINGDTYMKYIGGDDPIIDDEYTTNVWSGDTRPGANNKVAVPNFDLSQYYYIKVYTGDISGYTFADIPVPDIGVVGENNPYTLSSTYYNQYLEKSEDGKTLYFGTTYTGTATTRITKIDGRKVTYVPPEILNIFGKIENEWVDFPKGVESVNDLNDVDITTPTDGQVLSYDATNQEWINADAGSDVSVTQVQSSGTKIATITVDNVDTDLYAPTPTEVEANPQGTGSTDLTKIGIDGTVYDIPTGGSGSSTLAGLTDVDLSSPTDGQGLVYDATNQKWVNDDVGSGSLTAVEMDYEDWLELPQSEREDPTIEYFLSNAPGGGGSGGGDLSAYELTQTQYNNLPTIQKLDDKELYFINNNITTEETIDVTDFVNKVESGGTMAITADATNNTLTYVWGGAATIGANSFYPTVIPSNVSRINYRITTGTSYTTSDNQFKIGIGVKTTYDAANWAKPSDANWVAIDIYNTQNTVIEGSLDLSEVDEDTYFYICGHGWNMTIEDLTIVTVNESTDPTKIMYKDVEYGNGSSSGGGNLYGTTDPTNDLGNNGDIYMKYQGGSEPVEGETETLTNVYLEITKENDWVALPNFDASLYYSVIFNYSPNQELSTKINISDISTDANNPTIFGNTYDDLYGYINNSTLYLKTVIWSTVINSAIVTLNVFQPPQILNVYGKVEDEWARFPEEGYEETTLWEGSQSITQYSVPFTIPDIGMAELNKYDAFAFDFYNTYSIPRLGIMLTSYIKNHKDFDVTLAPDPTDGAKPLLIHYDSTNDVLKAFATTNYGYTLTKVIGIKYGNGGGGSSSLNYSTDEQVVGTWVDGKPIYELTLAKAVNFPGSNTWKTLDIAMSTYNIKQIFDVTIVGTENTGNVPALLHPESVEPINDYICVYHNFNWNMTSSHIILRYTKTTDV